MCKDGQRRERDSDTGMDNWIPGPGCTPTSQLWLSASLWGFPDQTPIPNGTSPMSKWFPTPTLKVVVPIVLGTIFLHRNPSGLQPLCPPDFSQQNEIFLAQTDNGSLSLCGMRGGNQLISVRVPRWLKLAPEFPVPLRCGEELSQTSKHPLHSKEPVITRCHLPQVPPPSPS